MNDLAAPNLHLVSGLFLAVLSALFVVGKVLSKFLDDWWDKSKAKSNGNGDVKRLCFLGEGGADRIVERMDAHYDRLREIVHENHAAALAIMTRLADALQSRSEVERDISVTLKLIEKHLDVSKK